MALTNVGEQVLDLVIPYIHDVDDRSSVSLVSRKFYEIDGITRKCLTVHTLYYPNPASLSKRFPFIESLTLKGPPSGFKVRDDHVIQIAPWIQQLALEFSSLKELQIHNLVVHDEDLETLASTRGKDLRTLKIKKCKGYSTDGLMHVSKYCNQLRNLCLGHSLGYIDVKDGIWLHELALKSTVLEVFKFRNTDIFIAEDLTLLAKNCCNSLKKLKIGECYLSELGDAFRYARRLERFGGYICDEESDLVGFQFPPNTRSLSIVDLPVTRCSTVLRFLNHIRKLKLAFFDLDPECQCLLFKQCPNLEVETEMDLFNVVKHNAPTKLKIKTRIIAPGEEPLLASTAGRTVPLPNPEEGPSDAHQVLNPEPLRSVAVDALGQPQSLDVDNAEVSEAASVAREEGDIIEEIETCLVRKRKSAATSSTAAAKKSRKETGGSSHVEKELIEIHDDTQSTSAKELEDASHHRSPTPPAAHTAFHDHEEHIFETSELTVIFRPNWSLPSTSKLSSRSECKDFVDHITPPGRKGVLDSLTDADLLGEMNMVTAHQATLTAQLRDRFVRHVDLVHTLEERDEEIAQLKEQLAKEKARADLAKKLFSALCLIYLL